MQAVARFALTATTVVLLSKVGSATVIIDDYSTQIGGTGLDLSGAGAGSSDSAVDAGITLAGTTGDRTTTLTLTAVLAALPIGDIDLQTVTLASPFLVDGNYNLDPGNFLNSNSGLGTNGFTIELVYDNFPSALNLATKGTRFEFGSGDFDIDQRNPAVFLPYEIEVESGTGTDSASVLVSDEGIYTIDFSSYTGVDFSDVTRITMTFGGQVQTPDFLIGAVAVVPEPGSLLLIGMGVLGLAVSRRRSA